jgi:hypothetical protein
MEVPRAVATVAAMDERGNATQQPDPDRGMPVGRDAAWPPSRGASGLVTDSRLDELAATEARVRYRIAGMTPIAPDPLIARSLLPGEAVLAAHRAILADSRAFPEASVPADGVSGRLYLTRTRLVFIGGLVVAFSLLDVEEADLSGEHLLLVLRDGVGLLLAVDQPRLLRVQIAAARAAARPPTAATPAAASLAGQP